MKRMLSISIALVLMASISHAAMVGLQLAPGSTPVAGGNVTIQLKADSACDGFAIGAIGNGGAGGLLVPAGANPVTFGTGISVVDAGYVDNQNGILFDYVNAYGSPAVAAGNVLMSFVYKISNSWNGIAPITIAPLAQGASYVIDGVTYYAGKSYGNLGLSGQVEMTGVTITPEPVTVALLGLGGLFLRRRK